MKTISLKKVKDGLSRDEMRAVKGGCFGYGGGCKVDNFSCASGCIQYKGGEWICSTCCVI